MSKKSRVPAISSISDDQASHTLTAAIASKAEKAFFSIPAWVVSPIQRQVYLLLRGKAVQAADLKMPGKVWFKKLFIQTKLNYYLRSSRFKRAVLAISSNKAKARKPIPGSKLREPVDTSEIDSAAELFGQSQRERRVVQSRFVLKPIIAEDEEKIVAAFNAEMKAKSKEMVETAKLESLVAVQKDNL